MVGITSRPLDFQTARGKRAHRNALCVKRISENNHRNRLTISYYSDICEPVSLVIFCWKGFSLVVLIFKFEENILPTSVTNFGIHTVV